MEDVSRRKEVVVVVVGSGGGAAVAEVVVDISEGEGARVCRLSSMRQRLSKREILSLKRRRCTGVYNRLLVSISNVAGQED